MVTCSQLFTTFHPVGMTARPQPALEPPTLRLLSFNMQVGIGTKRYHEYITRGWRHLLPSLQVQENLTRIAGLIADYDIVGLQEIDAGSRRSQYLNQIEVLAEQAGFDYWHTQVNRNLGHVAQHGVGLLSRFAPRTVSEHKLPGVLPGRGALLAEFGVPDTVFAVVVTHLALTRRSRRAQLTALRALIDPFPHAVIMGDINCGPERLRLNTTFTDGKLHIHDAPLPTFPSWRPRRAIDHILPTSELAVLHAAPINVRLSDHLPLATTLAVPSAVANAWRQANITNKA